MVVRPNDKKVKVVVSRIIDVGVKKPESEPPMGEKERLIKEVRFLLADSTVSVSTVKDFDLKGFLDGITLAQSSKRDNGIIVVSGGKFYKFYVEDLTADSLPISVDKERRIRLDDGEQAYYLFPISRI